MTSRPKTMPLLTGPPWRVRPRLMTTCLALLIMMMIGSTAGKNAKKAANQIYKSASKKGKGYPKNALICHASLFTSETKMKKNYIICPESRNNYCVKEVVSLPGSLCGKTQYFGDRYESSSSTCLYRKCADTCTHGRQSFTYQGNQYYRDTYCCNKDKCNASAIVRPTLWGALAVGLLTMWSLWRHS